MDTLLSVQLDLHTRPFALEFVCENLAHKLFCNIIHWTSQTIQLEWIMNCVDCQPTPSVADG